MKDFFIRVARETEKKAASPWAFIIAMAVIVIWLLSGPFFGFSNTWQLIVNTGTTVVTFLMVFLIQASQNRDTRAIQLKLDELIRANERARNSLIDLEDRSDRELDRERRNLKS